MLLLQNVAHTQMYIYIYIACTGMQTVYAPAAAAKKKIILLLFFSFASHIFLFIHAKYVDVHFFFFFLLPPLHFCTIYFVVGGGVACFRLTHGCLP